METQQGNVLVIHTSEPKAETGKQVVFFRRKKVSEAESYRAVLVDSYKLPTACYMEGEGEETTVQDAEEVFTAAIAETFLDAAASILKRYCDENSKAESIAADLLTFAAVVVEMQAQQTSQRLNGDAIAAWYDGSKTAEDAAKRYAEKKDGAKLAAALREKYLSLASNNPAIQQSLAEKMIAYVNPEDTGHSICKALLKRLEKLSKASVDADEL